MKPAAFAYHAPRTVDGALEVLADAAPDAKVLAGGQSLIPLLNMRLAEPAHLVDINRIGDPGLAGVTTGTGGVTVGALARHTRVERDEAAAALQPLLRRVLRLVAHPVIRNRGTVVGSLVHADPAAELPALLTLLGGTVHLASVSGRREVRAADFFTGPLESAARPDELAVAATFPALGGPGPGVAGGRRAALHWGGGVAEVARRHGDYALVGVVAAVALDDDLRIASARAAYLSVAPVPVLLDLTDPCGARPAAACDWAAVARRATESVEPEADVHASAAYRRHLAGVLTVRALREACEDAAAATSRPADSEERT